jgi:hypothetical protein
LRTKVRLLANSATKIQQLWRKTIARSAFLDPARDYWIECYDEEQSDQVFYFNTWTQETSWTKPLAYKYFCDPKLGMKLQQVVKNAKQPLIDSPAKSQAGISIASELSDDELSPKKS